MNDVQVACSNSSCTTQSKDGSTEETSADSETDDVPLSVKAERKKINQEPDTTSNSDSTSTSESSTSSQSDSDGCKNTKRKFLQNIPKFDSKDWYRHKSFNRYWDHHRYVTSWYKKHCHVYKTLQKKFPSHAAPAQTSYHHYPNPHQHPYSYPHPPPYHSFMSNVSQMYSNPRPVVPKSGRAKRRRSSGKQFSERSVALKRKQTSTGMDVESEAGEVQSNDDVMSCDRTEVTEVPTLVPIDDQVSLGQMEIEFSEEMLDFFAKTQKHRKEREAEKKAEKQKQKEEKRVNIEEVAGFQKERTSEAPRERPGSRRTAEMKLLYGKGAAMIHGMETALQMTYDRNFDANQPRYWPNMPFRIVFSDT